MLFLKIVNEQPFFLKTIIFNLFVDVCTIISSKIALFFPFLVDSGF